jgi:DNA excision repair protein ERCC-2
MPHPAADQDALAPVKLALSVRDFVAPLEPSGSIDLRRTLALAEDDPMAMGARLHTKVQRRICREEPLARSEVPVETTLEGGEPEVGLRGRIDLLVAADPPILEEIKTTQRPAFLLEDLARDPRHPFLLQAQVYAWIRWRQDGVAPECRIRVISLLDEAETLVDVPFEPDAFTAWVEAQAQGHREAWRRARARREERRALATRIAFPFPEVRPGQAELGAKVGACLASGTPLLLQAPTGLGKTAAVLHPTLVRALEADLRVFYCTPRNSQFEVAEDLVRRLKAQGRDVRSVTLRARERVCPQETVDCRPEVCPRADGHYDRMKASGALEILHACGCADTEAIRELAAHHLLCPYELALDAARGADVVIGDYNYVFSPSSTLSAFFGTPEEARRSLVLVDEAHNLPARAAEWFSPALDAREIHALASRRLPAGQRGLKRSLSVQAGRCAALVEGFDGEHRTLVVDATPFLREEQRIGRMVAKAAARGTELTPEHPLATLARLWTDFCAVLRILGPEHILTWIPPSRLQITCADASGHLAPRMAGLASVVLLSATLKPFLFHQRLCGLAGRETAQVEVPSPFPPEHRKVLVVPQITTRYRERETQAPRIGLFLRKVLPLHPGNYLVFFPSFELLERTLPHARIPGMRVVAQPRRADAAQVASLLATLREERGVVMLAVMGGSLAEGIDLPGESLIGCVVAGPPLPPFGLERERIRAYFDARYGAGRAYAYTYPAMARAVQAAGRVIRTPADRGLLAFLDGRFLEPEFADCLPAGWFLDTPSELVSTSILEDVARFWKGPAS